MPAVPSTMIPLGTPLPSFTLTDAVSGREVVSGALVGTPLVVMFICNHCPYVIHVRDEIGRLAKDYLAKGVRVLAINSNSTVTHPQDGPANMKKLALEQGWAFPFAFDETQAVARSFKAACTPEFYVFDKEGRLAYRGQLDDSRPSKDTPVTGKDVRSALDALLNDKPVGVDQKPSIGCSIKWHPAA